MPDRSTETVLETVLGAYQLRASIGGSFQYCGRWAEHEPEVQRGVFHLIESGDCWVKGPALPTPLQLGKWDLIVFPRGSRHTLCSELDSAPQALDQTTQMLCGELHFQAGARNPVIDALPDSFVVRADEGGEAFRHLASVLSSTTQGAALGRQVILDKLADSLFVIAVCVYVRQSSNRRGLLGALADPRLAQALAAIHSEPGKDWTVESLAQVATMSRTAFATEFSDALGVSPIQYLTEWRIAEARRLLRDRSLSVAAIAEKLGYQSEAAFRRTFKRVAGVGPGQVRRQ